MDPMIARRTWRTLEPIHGMIYFSAEAGAEYERLGLSGQMGYFASRAAPMGPVPAEVVIATFYNFEPSLVRRAVPAAWGLATPTAILEARHTAVDKSLRTAFSADVLDSSRRLFVTGRRTWLDLLNSVREQTTNDQMESEARVAVIADQYKLRLRAGLPLPGADRP